MSDVIEVTAVVPITLPGEPVRAPTIIEDRPEVPAPEPTTRELLNQIAQLKIERDNALSKLESVELRNRWVTEHYEGRVSALLRSDLRRKLSLTFVLLLEIVFLCAGLFLIGIPLRDVLLERRNPTPFWFAEGGIIGLLVLYLQKKFDAKG